MKSLLKKTGYMVTSIGLGATLFLGNAYAKDNSPTEITITANKGEYTQRIRENEPLLLKQGETIKLDITAGDEDGIESHNVYVESRKLGHISSHSPAIKSSDERLSSIELNLFGYERDKTQVTIHVKDKQGNTAKKTLEVYFE